MGKHGFTCTGGPVGQKTSNEKAIFGGECRKYQGGGVQVPSVIGRRENPSASTLFGESVYLVSFSVQVRASKRQMVLICAVFNKLSVIRESGLLGFRYITDMIFPNCKNNCPCKS